MALINTFLPCGRVIICSACKQLLGSDFFKGPVGLHGVMALIGFVCLCVFFFKREGGEVSIPGEVQKLIVLGWRGNRRRKRGERRWRAAVFVSWLQSGHACPLQKSLQAQTGSH